MLFREHLDGCEVRGEAGAMQLVGLLDLVSLGDQDETVARPEFAESGFDLREKLNLLVGDGLGEALDTAVFLVGERHVRKLFEAGDERAAKAVQTVAVGEDGGVLDPVEVSADLFRGVDAMVEVGDEAGDRPFEVDVVLPEGVVGVDQQSLVSEAAVGLDGGAHMLIIRCGLIPN